MESFVLMKLQAVSMDGEMEPMVNWEYKKTFLLKSQYKSHSLKIKILSRLLLVLDIPLLLIMKETFMLWEITLKINARSLAEELMNQKKF